MVLIAKQLESRVGIAGAALVLDVEIMAGASNAVISWTKDGTDISESSRSLVRNPLREQDAGLYTVRVEAENKVEVSSAVVAVIGAAGAAPWPFVWDKKAAMRTALVTAAVWLLMVGGGLAAALSIDGSTRTHLIVAGLCAGIALGAALLLGAFWLAVMDLRSRAHGTTAPLSHDAAAVVKAVTSSSHVAVLVLAGLACLGMVTAVAWRMLP